jgi:lipoprotein-anchoring transpeptidase ErfK/SrfK
MRLGRIAGASVSVYKMPWDQSRIIFTHYRDEVINLYFEVVAENGPAWNPIWYRVWGGYIHSKFVQIVEDRKNIVYPSVRKTGQLAEVTVPFIQSMRSNANGNWDPLYRLYYGSVHWVVEMIEGPDHGTWYRIQEPWGHLTYDVPGEAMRFIPDEVLLPISPDVAAEDKRIEVSITRQELIAYEKDNIVFRTKVSTGLNVPVPEGAIPWATPVGNWNIKSKMPSQHMGNGNLTSDVEAYELAGVPWVCYFHVNGNATHGTYWHTNFGNPMSHGCINMRIEDAKWIFLWSTPVWSPTEGEKTGNGTVLIVSK